MNEYKRLEKILNKLYNHYKKTKEGSEISDTLKIQIGEIRDKIDNLKKS